MAALGVWIQAARPRTLPAALAPVALGTALGSQGRTVDWLAAGACLLGALLIQIGCNYANDACDGLRGTDGPGRLGPQRAVAAGLVAPRAMLLAAGLVLGLAFLVGLHLVQLGGWPILALGLASIACAFLYTGGPFPLAYHGLGDVFCFVFFGLGAVLGAAWVQAAPHGLALAQLPPAWWLCGAAIGCQATAILCVNNLRDIANDGVMGKRTIAVRLGAPLTRVYHLCLHLGAAACLGLAAAQGMPWTPLWLACAIAGGAGLRAAVGLWACEGRALNPWLGRVALVELASAAGAVAGLALV